MQQNKSGANDGGKNNFYTIPEEVTTYFELQEYLELTTKERILMNSASLHIGTTTTDIPSSIEDLDELNFYWGDSFFFGNFLKTFWLHKGNRHNGTNKKRELNKRKHYYKQIKKFIKESEIQI